MKKTLALLLALVMILGLAACGQSAAPAAATPAPAAEPAPAEAAPEAKTYKVGVAIYQFDDNFMTLYRNEMLDYFKSLETDDVKYDVTIVDGKNDMAEQNNQIDNFITQGMDAIILNLVQTSSADAARRRQERHGRAEQPDRQLHHPGYGRHHPEPRPDLLR